VRIISKFWILSHNTVADQGRQLVRVCNEEGEKGDWEMVEGRSNDLVSHPIEGSRNGSSAHDDRGRDDQAAVSREGVSSFPELPRWKRVFDVTCVLMTLPFWLPLIVLVMVWIAISSRGPVFFRQKRVGYRRRPFMLFKFRTMHVNAETQIHAEHFFRLMEKDCPMTKLDAAGDPRLIAGGRFLRASGLDELPQIFNVLRGEMSLVGPRPCLPHEFERYSAWQQERVNAAPGLTGYWQVNGKNKTTFSEMIAMDIFYARNMSVWLDVKIISKTIPALIEQTLETNGAPETESRQRTVRPAALPEATSGVANRI
jgi:lipopolysaccharide/colanic/teichoic acid biosynthesis glycosyltransferase